MQMRKIFPIVAIILLTMVSCHRSESSYTEDCFTIEYRQSVNGYLVKAEVNMEDDVLAANLTFMKDGISFSLHTTSFGDTLYNKGQWGLLERTRADEEISKPNDKGRLS